MCPWVSQNVRPLGQSLTQSVGRLVSQSVSLLARQSKVKSVSQSVSQSVSPSVRLSVHQSVSQSGIKKSQQCQTSDIETRLLLQSKTNLCKDMNPKLPFKLNVYVTLTVSKLTSWKDSQPSVCPGGKSIPQCISAAVCFQGRLNHVFVFLQ